MNKTCWCDVDDLLLDFTGGFNEYLKEKGYNRDRSYVPKTWNYLCTFKTERVGRELLGDFIMNHCGDLEMLGNAAAMVETIRNTGWKVNLITAHPALLQIERFKNLKKYGIEFDNYYSTCHFDQNGDSVYWDKYGLIRSIKEMTEDSVDVLLDDRHSTVRKFVKKGLGVGVTVGYPYNDESIEQSANEDTLDEKLNLIIAPWEGDKYSTLERFHDKIVQTLQDVDLMLEERGEEDNKFFGR